MAVVFEDLHAKSGLKSLEDFLAGKTYNISGDHLTKDDIKLQAFMEKAAGVKIGGSTAPVEAVAPAEDFQKLSWT
ncbi:hypothetical protein QQ045_007349 [Rhodiola kirilowii]